MTQSLIALGANLGDPLSTLRGAAAELALLPETQLLARSRVYLTVPVGQAAGNRFHNAVVLLETSLEPLRLLDELQRLERASGRIRTHHWGPRTLDLDLLSYGQEVIRDPRLLVPHPALWCRRFVLDPLCDVAPHWNHPQLQCTAQELLARLKRRPLRIAVMQHGPLSQELTERITQEFGGLVTLEPVVERADLIAGPADPGLSPAFWQIPWTGDDPLGLTIESIRGALDEPQPLSDAL